MVLAAAFFLASSLAAVPPPPVGGTPAGSGPALPQPAEVSIPAPAIDGAPAPGPEEPPDEQVVLLRNAVRSLTESLALANSEAEVFKRQAGDLSLRLEALGVAGIEGKPDKLQQRLVAAVRDLRVLQKREEAARSQLVGLSETLQLVVAAALDLDPELRATAEAAVRKTNEVLGAADAPGAAPVEATLTNAMVVDTKDDLALVVANAGSKQGVRLGMPFYAWRDGRRIGVVRVVDVRERISGAIVQSLENEKNPIKSGDHLKVDAKP